MSLSHNSAIALLVLFPCVAFALSPDENLLLNRVREVTAAPVEDFHTLGQTAGARDGCYRYQLAFLAYGLCSAVEGEPSLRGEARVMFTKLIEKMEHPTTLRYWRALGFGGDGAKIENVMYRGHLNLMYALAHDRFGETRFDGRFHELSQTLCKELGGERPICCEPDHLFVQCNAVTVLSLFLHDRAFGTDYASAGKQLLTWGRKHMPLEGTVLVRENYRPSTGKSSAWRAGCANAWTISFLAPVPGFEDEASAMYADWRRTFVEPSLIPGAVKGAPQGEDLPTEEMNTSELLATTFGLLAAREAGDEKLHQHLEWSVSKLERAIDEFTWVLPPSCRAQARTFQTIALFSRTFRGWNEVLKIKKELYATNTTSER